MVSLIIGAKGSGKTKYLINQIERINKVSEGIAVCIEKGSVSTFRVPHEVRLINIDEYVVNNYQDLKSFLLGLCSGNYDITDIFIDSIFRIAGRDYNEFNEFIKEISKDKAFRRKNLVITVSCKVEDLPAEIFNYASNLTI